MKYQEEEINSILISNSQPISLYFSEDDKNKLIKSKVDSVYSNPYRWLIELVTNGIDACKEANKPIKVDLIYDNTDILTLNGNGKIIIRDYGTGMSLDRMLNNYTAIGNSTKEDNEGAIGFFGIGRLSVLKYTKLYEINSYYQGTKYSFLMGLQDVERERRGEKYINKEYTLCNIFNTTTTEEDGLEVIVELNNSKDINNITSFINKEYLILQEFVNIVNIKTDLKYKEVWKSENCKILENHTHGGYMSISLGGVLYDLDDHKEELLTLCEKDKDLRAFLEICFSISSNIIFFVPLNKVKPTESRESIDIGYTKTLPNILEVVNKVKNEICDYLLTEIEKITNFFEILHIINSGSFKNSYILAKSLQFITINKKFGDTIIKDLEDLLKVNYRLYKISNTSQILRRNRNLFENSWNNTEQGKQLTGIDETIYKVSVEKYSDWDIQKPLIYQEFSKNDSGNIYSQILTKYNVNTAYILKESSPIITTTIADFFIPYTIDDCNNYSITIDNSNNIPKPKSDKNYNVGHYCFYNSDVNYTLDVITEQQFIDNYINFYYISYKEKDSLNKFYISTVLKLNPSIKICVISMDLIEKLKRKNLISDTNHLNTVSISTQQNKAYTAYMAIKPIIDNIYILLQSNKINFGKYTVPEINEIKFKVNHITEKLNISSSELSLVDAFIKMKIVELDTSLVFKYKKEFNYYLQQLRTLSKKDFNFLDSLHNSLILIESNNQINLF
jgi:hypothetical protein